MAARWRNRGHNAACPTPAAVFRDQLPIAPHCGGRQWTIPSRFSPEEAGSGSVARFKPIACQAGGTRVVPVVPGKVTLMVIEEVRYGCVRSWLRANGRRHVPACFGCTSLTQVVLDTGETSRYPGWSKVEPPVVLSVNGTSPSSVGHALFFPDPRNVKAARRCDGKPDCRLSANISTLAEFVFWPAGCVCEEDECDTVRVLCVDLFDTQPPFAGWRAVSVLGTNRR